MITVANYIARRIADAGIRHVFLLTGGGAMHLNDAFGSEPRLTYVCNHHEQACAMAAEGYARVSGMPAAINVTTGPGGINAINGVFGAYTDSIPMLIVSGQVKRDTCMAFREVPALRQLGDQEVDIISMVRGVTKHAIVLRDANDVRYELERALHLMTEGRPGPCWIDVPSDIQAKTIDETSLRGFEPPPASIDAKALSAHVDEVLARLRAAKRPVLLVGSGVRVAGAVEVFDRVVRKLGVPVATAWTTHDLMDSEDPLFAGRPGTVGDRAGNFAVQNSDALLILGCRLAIRQVSYNWEWFARAAYKMQVDVDAAELSKPTVRPDLPIVADLRVFLEALERRLVDDDAERHRDWAAWCVERRRRYPVVTDAQRQSMPINPYHFIDVLVRHLDDEDVIVCGDGAACVVTFQVAHLRKGQRLFTNAGSASMGYDLPAAIGAAFARGGKRVICLAGDGSVQLNLQELQTIVHHQLPIKIFVLNNGGYQSIRQTQSAYFGRLVGESPQSGVSFPDMTSIAQAYGIAATRIAEHDFDRRLDEVLASDGPMLCEAMLDAKQVFEPKLSSRKLPDGKMVSSPLEDMFPFLSREELRENMFIPLLEE